MRFAEGSCGKLEQTPWLRLLPTAGDLGPIEAGEAIVLAIVEVDATGLRRCGIGPRGSRTVASCSGKGTGELRIRRTATGRSGRRCAGRQDRRADGGGLRLSVADAADAMILDREDGGRFSRLEVQADEARLAGNSRAWAASGWRGWRLRPGGSEADPSTCSRSADEVVAHDGGHVPLQVRHQFGDGNASSRPDGAGHPRLRPPLRGREAALNVRDASGTHEVMLGIDEGGGVIATMTEHDLQLRAGGDQPR